MITERGGKKLNEIKSNNALIDVSLYPHLAANDLTVQKRAKRLPIHTCGRVEETAGKAQSLALGDFGCLQISFLCS